MLGDGMLANLGPLPDGSLSEEGVKVLREVGRRIRAHGMPTEEAVITPQSSCGAAAQ